MQQEQPQAVPDHGMHGVPVLDMEKVPPLPEDPALVKGGILHEASRIEEAIECYRAAIAAAPDHAVTRVAVVDGIATAIAAKVQA